MPFVLCSRMSLSCLCDSLKNNERLSVEIVVKFFFNKKKLCLEFIFSLLFISLIFSCIFFFVALVVLPNSFFRFFVDFFCYRRRRNSTQ